MDEWASIHMIYGMDRAMAIWKRSPIIGIAPLTGPYGGYNGDSGDRPHSMYSTPRDETSYVDSDAEDLKYVIPQYEIGMFLAKGEEAVVPSKKRKPRRGEDFTFLEALVKDNF
ncbi:hypothetical protein RYX36_006888 [Vicia faba]